MHSKYAFDKYGNQMSQILEFKNSARINENSNVITLMNGAKFTMTDAQINGTEDLNGNLIEKKHKCFCNDNTDKLCKNCTFFFSLERSTGECRRHAPISLHDMPKVIEVFWCGEFKPICTAKKEFVNG